MLKPDAVPTTGVCHRCGAEIEAMYVVLLCADCLDMRIAELDRRETP